MRVDCPRAPRMSRFIGYELENTDERMAGAEWLRDDEDCRLWSQTKVTVKV